MRHTDIPPFNSQNIKYALSSPDKAKVISGSCGTIKKQHFFCVFQTSIT